MDFVSVWGWYDTEFVVAGIWGCFGLCRFSAVQVWLVRGGGQCFPMGLVSAGDLGVVLVFLYGSACLGLVLDLVVLDVLVSYLHEVEFERGCWIAWIWCVVWISGYGGCWCFMRWID